MRLSLWFVILALASSRSNVASLDDQYRNANDLLHGEQYDVALARIGDSLSQAEQSGDPRIQWRFRLLKAEILLGQRLASQALAVLDGHGDIPDAPDWAEQKGRALVLRGQALYLLNRFPEAQACLSRAADAAREAHSPSLAAEVELQRGTLLAKQRRFGEAREAFQNTLENAARLGNRYLEARATGNTGYSLFAEDRFDEAIPFFERTRELSLQLGASESAARADGSLGNCYRSLGDYDHAKLLYTQAQAAFVKSGNRFEQQAWLGNSGNVFLEAGDYAGAVKTYTRALAIARDVKSPVWIARWLSSLATASIELGQWDAAEGYNNEALLLKRRLDDTGYEANSLNNAARIAAGRGHFKEAASLYRQALKIASEDPTTELEAHAGLAGLAVRNGQPREAEDEFQTAIAAIDRRGASLRKDDYKLSWRSSLIAFYGEYVDFLMADGQPLRALEISESSRSRVLAGSTQPADRPASKDYQRLARGMNAVLLEYWIGEKQSYLWVITPERVESHTLPSKSALHPLLESYNAITTGGRNPLEAAGETGRKLYDTLIAPAEADAPNRRQFIIVPDGDLYAFNFESLPSAEDAGIFWIERATIAIAPSLNYLAESAQADVRRPREKLLLIGDPVSSGPQYPRLEFASQEMDSIASAMAGSETTILKGADARPDSYAQAVPGRFGFIHFSAHAAANVASPLDSAVILSGSSDRSKLLARDVMTQPLTAELVTVSACRSAGGRTYAGEGLVGFAWAFLKAGAGTVIAGLWDVNDRSTAELMSGLYSNIAAGETIPEALRASKLALIHKGGAYAKPFYWAPFQVYTGSAAVTGRVQRPGRTPSG